MESGETRGWAEVGRGRVSEGAKTSMERIIEFVVEELARMQSPASLLQLRMSRLSRWSQDNCTKSARRSVGTHRQVGGPGPLGCTHLSPGSPTCHLNCKTPNTAVDPDLNRVLSLVCVWRWSITRRSNPFLKRCWLCCQWCKSIFLWIRHWSFTPRQQRHEKCGGAFCIVLSQQMELYTKNANETHTPGNEKYVKTHKPQTPAANSTPRLVHYAVEQKTTTKKMHAQRSKA